MSSQGQENCTICCILFWESNIMVDNLYLFLHLFYNSQFYYYFINLLVPTMFTSPPLNPSNPITTTMPESNPAKNIKVYIRRPNKSTVIVFTTDNMSGSELRQLASMKTNTPIQNIVLFLRGQKIGSTQEQSQRVYLIGNCDILHVHNTNHHKNILMDIILKPYQCSAFDSQEQIHFTTKSHYKIRDSLRDHIKITDDLSFVESGRKLDIDRSYEEELLQNNSIVYITTFRPPTIPNQKLNKQIPCKKQKNNERFASEQHSIFQKNVAEMQEVKRRKVVLPPIRSSLKKSMSWGETDSGNLMSFKKKQKPSIYKSMKIMDGKEEVWVSDSSGDLKNNLKKQIALKKHRDPSEIKQQVSVDQKLSDGSQQIVTFSDDEKQEVKKTQNAELTSEQRKQLRKQLNKLLFADLFDFKPTISVPPPQMKTDDFLQQSDQIEIKRDGYEVENEYVDSDDAEEEEEEEQEKTSDKLKGSNDLRQSIGKSRGSFIVPMIPTRDFERNSSSDQDEDQ